MINSFTSDLFPGVAIKESMIGGRVAQIGDMRNRYKF
jgi:hypothetical protein